MSRKRDRDAQSEPVESVLVPDAGESPQEVAAPLQEVAAPLQAIEVPLESKLPEQRKFSEATKPQDPSDLMPLRVWATIAGPKWDQLAGFVNWAQRQKLGPLSMAAWTQAFADFKNRPVG